MNAWNAVPAADLVRALPGRKHVLITGATGFIGRRLAQALVGAGHEVTALVRDPGRAAATVCCRMVTDLDQIAPDTAIDAVINLAGEPVSNGPWTRRKRRLILASRLRVTRAVVRLIARLEHRPDVLVSGSAIGWYGLWGDETLTEFDGGKRCFTHRVCEAWERAAHKAQKFGTRVVRLRLGVVLATDGGALGKALPLFRWGLGAVIASGEQWVSWIARDDAVRLIAHIIAHPQYTGAVNATAPVPVRHATFVHELAHAVHRPARLRMPASLLRFIAGDMARELVIGGQRVIPDKAAAQGFAFRHDTLRSALSAELGEVLVGEGGERADASEQALRASPQMGNTDFAFAPERNRVRDRPIIPHRP
jgi:uncharacterized protein (TIGR01777 family)